MQQTASTTVNIHIIDVNNKPPKFDLESYTQYVNESKESLMPDIFIIFFLVQLFLHPFFLSNNLKIGIEIGEHVLMLTASDPDKDSKIRYTIVEPIIVRDKTGLLLDASNEFKVWAISVYLLRYELLFESTFFVSAVSSVRSKS